MLEEQQEARQGAASDPTTYVIRVMPSPGFDQRHERRRLARLLKSMQRSFGFKCVSVLPELERAA